MKIKNPLWNLHFGNKGIIFMLDAVIAVTVVLILITASYYYVIKSEEDITPNLQIVRTGSDIVTSLDNQDLLGPADLRIEGKELEEIIGEKIGNFTLFLNYDLYITIESCEMKKTEECEAYSIGNTIPNDRFVATGKRYFTKIIDDKKFYYGMIKYWIWLK